MKRLLPLFVGLLFFAASCSGTEPTAETEKIEIEPQIPEEDTFDYDTLQGMYIGDFAGSNIRIILNYVSSKNAIGYNIHKGLQRNISGKVSRSGDSITMVLQEPGDNPYDGTFTLLFIGDDLHPSGKWESFSGKISTKKFKLDKIVVKEIKDEGDINDGNLATYFNYLADDNGHFEFHEDGLCIYQYYPKEDYEDYMQQYVEIQGTWSVKGKTVTVDWQPNQRFPDRQTEFIVTRSEYGEFTLALDGVELYNYYYGP